MWTFVIRRTVSAVPTLLVVIAIAFFMIRLAPGGPFDKERVVPAEISENLNRVYHLDEPLPRQFLRYLTGLLQGDFGPSFKYRDFSVTELIAAGFPISLKIGGLAILVAIVLGLTLGIYAAERRNTAIDHLVMSLAMTGIAVPNFVVAPLLTLVLGVYLNLLPVGGLGDGSIRHLVLPVIALALPQVAYIARLARGSMIEVLASDYIRTARAKGLPRRTIIVRHALKGALAPVVSYLGPATAAIVTGSVVIEQIFGIPGLGRYFVQGALNRDYTLVMGVVVFYGALIIALNMAVDMIYGFLDPRVRND